MRFAAELGELGNVGRPPPQGFGQWVEPHLRVLHAVAARELGSDEAADAVQDALLKAWRRWETYSPDRGTPRAWLVTILVNGIRRRRLRGRLSKSPHHDVDARSQLAEWDRRIDARLDVERAIRSLAPRQRQAVVLFYLADLSIDDVARVLNISPGSVKKHLSEARLRLRNSLDKS